MESFGERVARLRSDKGLSQEELAERTGISRAHLSQIETGNTPNPRRSTLTRLASVLGREVLNGSESVNRDGRHVIVGQPAVDSPALDLGRAEVLELIGQLGDVVDPYMGLAEVRVVAEVAAGSPIEYLPDEEHEMAPRDLLPGSNGEVVIRVRGDSMVDFGIQDGALVLVDLRRGGVVAYREIIVAHLNGGAVIKRWMRAPGGGRMLQSGNASNAEVRSHVITADDEFEVIGVVRRWWNPGTIP